MAIISLAPVPRADDDAQPTEVERMRKRERQLITERDRLNDKVGELAERLETLIQQQQHRLVIKCDGGDGFTCPMSVIVGTTAVPNEGKLAAAIARAARALEWEIGSPTAVALMALGAGFVEADPTAHDACPAHRRFSGRSG